MRWSGAVLAGLTLVTTTVFAQVDGSARFTGAILDYNGAGAEHWAVAWVTYENGTFIKSLRKQGPGWTDNHWGSHCRAWNDARGGSASGSQALDGYSSATVFDYSGVNSPVTWTWNCRDANNNLVPDGNYKFWIQYAEDSGQGPHTTNGMLWAKGPTAATNTYPNIPGRIVNLTNVWTPTIPTTYAPKITSAAPTATATLGVPYNYSCVATGTAPIRFSASGLPAGLAMSIGGVISGTPTSGGPFSGTITATNGTLPNATQAYSVNVGVVPTTISSVTLSGNQLVMRGTGPANGTYVVLSTTNVTHPLSQWQRLATNSFNASGQFNFTNTVDLAVPSRCYRVRVP
jgi:hypothetical protein